MKIIKIAINIVIKILNFILKKEVYIRLLISYLEKKEKNINNQKLTDFFQSFLPNKKNPTSRK